MTSQNDTWIERFDDKFKFLVIESENDEHHDMYFKDYSIYENVKNFIGQEIERARNDAIDECIKEIREFYTEPVDAIEEKLIILKK